MKTTIKKIILYVLFFSIPMGFLFANEEISEWQKMVDDVRSETNKVINQNANSQTAIPQIQNGENVFVEKILNPNFTRLKQELINIDNQIEQVRKTYQSQSSMGLLNEVSSLPSSFGSGGGSLFSVFSSAAQPILAQQNRDAQRDAQLQPLYSHRDQIQALLENTPQYIENSNYTTVSTPASVSHTKEKAYMVLTETNVMAAPSKKSEVLGTIPKEYAVRIFEVKNGWARVGVNKWILEKYLIEMAE